MKIYIAVPCHNRKSIAALCIPTILAARRSGTEDAVTLWNDGSTEYDWPWLEKFKPDAVMSWPPEENMGVEKQRILHLKTFFLTDFTHLYFTDLDAIHDPSALSELLRLQGKYGGAPICGYDTIAHSSLFGNTIEDNPDSEVIWRRVAPGISYLLTRYHVERIMPRVEHLTAFDWEIPAILGGRFAVTRRSVVDHIGFGGLRHPPGASLDQGDRCNNPTPWLVEKRAEVVKELQNAAP
jgi:hypothetical protein